MGLIDDKKNIFTEIGSFNSLKSQKNLPDLTSQFSSVNNKKDAVAFMLDLLKVLLGSTALQKATGKLMTDFINSVEPDIKTALKKQSIQHNSNDNLPSGFVNSGIDISVSKIDTKSKFKTDPSSTHGSLTYSNNSEDFDNKVYSAIANPNTNITFGNVLKINYNETLDTLNFKPLNSNIKIGDFLTGFVDGMKIIDPKTFSSGIMDLLFGTITTNQNKTEKQILNELMFNATLQKLLDEEENQELNNNEILEANINAKNLKNGYNYLDIGCTSLNVSLPLADLKTLITNTSGSTDPFLVASQYSKAFDTSLNNNTNPTLANNNQQTIHDGFFQKLIKFIYNYIAQCVTNTPQIRTLLAITSYFEKGFVNIDNPLDDLKKFKIFINCNINAIKTLLNKFIFDLVKTELLNLLTPIAKEIIKEKINQYIKTLQSLLIKT